MANALNYADEYQKALVNAFPHVLHFGALYATPNNGRYRWTNSKTIEIPSLSTTGRVNADRDTIGFASRNYENAWTSLTLKNQRKWSTLVHPRDIDETNQVASIANITQTFNEFQKFPEMDSYVASTLYAEATTSGVTPDTATPTVDTILDQIDALMLKMDNERVPATGRILYLTNEMNLILKKAIDRVYLNGEGALNRTVSRIEELQVVPVPASIMKTAYDFSVGAVAASTAKQINFFIVHPQVVITPVSYTFAQLSEPSAISEGKYVYYEESFEDVFLLPKRAQGIQFNVEA